MDQQLTHDFDTSADALWTRYFYDEAFVRAFFRAVGLEPVDVHLRTIGEDVVERTLVLESARRLPSVIERVFGGVRRSVQRERWDRQTHRVDVDIDLPVIGRRTAFTGHYEVEALPGGRCRRTWRARVEVRLPFVGGRLEAYILDEIATTLDAFHRLAHAGLCAEEAAGAR